MELTSFVFLCFYTLIILLYFTVAARFQWVLLLAAGVVFQISGAQPLSLLFPAAASIITWGLARCLPKETGAAEDAAVRIKRRCMLAVECAALLGVLIFFKYRGLFGLESDTGRGLIPMGLSFYTFILLGYFIEVYQGLEEPEKNPLRLLAGGAYFPLLISGPIVKYGELRKELFLRHRLSYHDLTFGLQRMVWGFFKKLVISERLALIVNAVYAGDSGYSGIYVWIAAMCFTLQLYTDFSGCMDIVIGASEALGINLPENFRTPFFSLTVAEFWRRWHMTLGEWLKDKVFYPLLRSGLFMKQGELLRNAFGKKTGKKLNTFLAMFILWFTVGLWHGGDWKFVLGTGIIQWIYIVVSESTEPLWKKLSGGRKKEGTSKPGNALRMIRTFLLISFSFIFFRAESTADAIRLIRAGFSVFSPVRAEGAAFLPGIGAIEAGVLFISLIVLFVISLIQYRAENSGEKDTNRVVRQRLAGAALPVRWILLFVLLFSVILLGQYGPGTSAAEFIYKGF